MDVLLMSSIVDIALLSYHYPCSVLFGMSCSMVGIIQWVSSDTSC